ncbi:MAG: hypothetical protein JSS75_03940 [Bacteroidetes bacterium]|nr:hypothetical protein [Bacteroidota bacterium]
MSKRPQNSWAFRFGSFAVALLVATMLSSCDRGATEQIQAAERFAEATARNNVGMRDSMIATRLFKSYFKNDYVASDFITYIQSIYDFRNHKFIRAASADVDKDFKADLTGGLLDATDIEETGMVKVKSPHETDPVAYFWMVKQKGQHWKVAMVTKGELQVDFSKVQQ